MHVYRFVFVREKEEDESEVFVNLWHIQYIVIQKQNYKISTITTSMRPFCWLTGFIVADLRFFIVSL